MQNNDKTPDNTEQDISQEPEKNESKKDKIRKRYQGLNPDEIDIIPALPKESFFEDRSEKRVAIYVRVSTDDPRQTSSFELQKNHYTDLVERHEGWKLVEIYADEGLSGTSTAHRKAFIKMIEDCKEGKIDLIVTKTVARFARNILDCIGADEQAIRLAERRSGEPNTADTLRCVCGNPQSSGAVENNQLAKCG